MKKRSKSTVMFAAAVLAAGLLFSGCSSKKAEDNAKETSAETAQDTARQTAAEPTGEDIVSFQTTTLTGESVDQSMFSDFKLTMVNVWATYCSPCISEMPELAEISKEYADKDFQMVGIVSDLQEGDDTSAANEIVSDTGADYTHLLLNQQVYMTFLDGVTAVPTTFFVDSEGKIVGERYVGAKSKEEWVEIIESLLQ